MPWIAKGASLLGGWLAGRHAQKSAMQRSPEEMAALQGATGSANALTQQGTTLSQTGLPALQKSLGYYQTLLGGNRAAMSLATAGPRASITDTYRGAARTLEQSGVRGGARDVATEELARDKAGKIAGLTAGVQPGAAGALADIGSNLTGQGTTALNAAGGVWQNLLGEGQKNRVYGRQEGEKAGTSIGSLLFDVLSGSFGKKNKVVSPYGGGGAGDQGPSPDWRF